MIFKNDDKNVEASIVLDHIDQKIIYELGKDGRISNLELAERIGLSASPCWNRVRSLEKKGVIRNYKAEIDYAKLGFKVRMLVQVKLERHDQVAMRNFERVISEMSEIVAAYTVTGEFDFHLEVLAVDTTGFERFLHQELNRLAGVEQIKSTLILREINLRA